MLLDSPSPFDVALSSTPGAHRTPSLSLSALPLVTHGVDVCGGGVESFCVAPGVTVVFSGVIVGEEIGVVVGEEVGVVVGEEVGVVVDEGVGGRGSCW